MTLGLDMNCYYKFQKVKFRDYTLHETLTLSTPPNAHVIEQGSTIDCFVKGLDINIWEYRKTNETVNDSAFSFPQT